MSVSRTRNRCLEYSVASPGIIKKRSGPLKYYLGTTRKVLVRKVLTRKVLTRKVQASKVQASKVLTSEVLTSKVPTRKSIL